MTPLLRSCPLWALLVLLAAAGCKEQQESPLSDAGGDAQNAGDGAEDSRPHDLTELTVMGSVSLNWGLSPATQVQITARCGDKEVQVTSGDDGSYELTANVENCEPLVLEYNKKSYLPNYRVIHLPPPATPLVLDVPLAELQKIVCGDWSCKAEGSFGPPLYDLQKQVQQGWMYSSTGPNALSLIPGEFRDSQGNLLTLLGFGYFELRDDEGALIDTLDPYLSGPQGRETYRICFQVSDLEALDWFADVELSTPKAELYWYSLNASTGRWERNDVDLADLADISYRAGDRKSVDPQTGQCVTETDPAGNPIPNIVDLRREELAAVRADELTYSDVCMPEINLKVNTYYVCATITGSGWFAWGFGRTQRSCFVIEAKDQCAAQLGNVYIQLQGRDHGYRTETWTDWDGQACLEVNASEPVGQDFDLDLLKGESFWANLEFTWVQGFAGSQKQLLSHQTGMYDPERPMSCATPESCVPLTVEFSSFGSCADQ